MKEYKHEGYTKVEYCVERQELRFYRGIKISHILKNINTREQTLIISRVYGKLMEDIRKGEGNEE